MLKRHQSLWKRQENEIVFNYRQIKTENDVFLMTLKKNPDEVNNQTTSVLEYNKY